MSVTGFLGMRSNPGRKSGQSTYFVLMLLLLAVMLALYFWYSAGTDYAQNAQATGQIRVEIFGKTAGDAVASGVGQVVAGPVTGPGAFDPNNPQGPSTTPVNPPPIGPGPQGGPGPMPGPGQQPGGGTGGPGTGPVTPPVSTGPSGGVIGQAPWLAEFYRKLKEKTDALPGRVIQMPDIQIGDLGPDLSKYAMLNLNNPALSIDKISAKITNVRRDLTFASQGVFDEKSYYREPLFYDGRRDQGGDGKDVVPRDFLADLVITYTIKSSVAGQTGSRTYTRVFDLRVSDTTPPAREFALFSYEPPHSEPYMLNDLNGPGFFAVMPNAKSRVFVRGPLMLRTEDPNPDAPNDSKIGLGGALRQSDSINWPTRDDNFWENFSAVPPPRAVYMPYLCQSVQGLIKNIGDAVSGNKALEDMLGSPPQRPRKKDTAPARLNLGLFTLPIPGIWLVGVTLDPRFHVKGVEINTSGSLAGFAGLYVPIPFDETIAVAGTTSYFAGSVGQDGQKFSITGLSPRMASTLRVNSQVSPSAADGVNPYQGLLLHKENKEGWAAPLALPLPTGPSNPLLMLQPGARQAGQARVEIKEDDLLVPEPAYYELAGGLSSNGGLDQALLRQGPGDQGIFGVYMIAEFKRSVYWNFDLLDLIKLVKGLFIASSVVTAGAGAGGAVAVQAAETGIRAFLKKLAEKIFGHVFMLSLIPLNYTVDIPATPPMVGYRPGADEKVILAPYGLYYDKGRGNFWAGEATHDLLLAGTGIGLNLLFKKIFTRKTGDQAKQSADDIAKTKTKDLAGEGKDAVQQSADDLERSATTRAGENAGTSTVEQVAQNSENVKIAKQFIQETTEKQAQAQAALDAARAAVEKKAAELAKAQENLRLAQQMMQEAKNAGDDAGYSIAANWAKEYGRSVGGNQTALNGLNGKLTSAGQVLATANGDVRAAQELLSEATGQTVATQAATELAEEQGKKGIKGSIARILGRTKKFSHHVWLKFVTAISKVTPRLVFERMKEIVKSQAFKTGAAIGLGEFVVRQIDSAWLRPHAADVRARLGDTLMPRPYAAQAREAQEVMKRDFPKGYLPPKYRFFPGGYSFTYPSLGQYMAMFGTPGQAELHIHLNGVVRVEDLDYSASTQKIIYHGRGVIVGVPSAANPTKNPVFNVAAVVAADPKFDHLTLVYEAPNVDIEKDAGIGQLLMGKQFQGTVYSSQGVRPADKVGTTVINGNLVCRHMNKSKMLSDSDAVIISYDLDRHAAGGWELERWWTTTVSPKVAGFTSN